MGASFPRCPHRGGSKTAVARSAETRLREAVQGLFGVGASELRDDPGGAVFGNVQGEPQVRGPPVRVLSAEGVMESLARSRVQRDRAALPCDSLDLV